MTRALALLAVLLLAAGCGVRPSGVIPGVQAPTGELSGTHLFLVRDGELTLVMRPARFLPLPEERVALLLAGPTELELADGLTSEVPPDTQLLAVSHDSVTLSVDVTGLSQLAADQIVCTAAFGVEVALLGGGGSRERRSCPFEG